MPLARTRPAPKSARKRAGTVSRFLASSEYSAVPSKAIAWTHGKKSDRGGGVGGAPPPRSGRGTYIPTTSHEATPIAQFFPPMPSNDPSNRRNPRTHGAFRRPGLGSDVCPDPAIEPASAQFATRRAAQHAFRPADVRPSWGVVGDGRALRSAAVTTISLSPRRLAVLAAAALAIPIA